MVRGAIRFARPGLANTVSTLLWEWVFFHDPPEAGRSQKIPNLVSLCLWGFGAGT